ncbi:FtsX-like permease family protein [Nocardioides sp. DS6]|uniref:FtsX-like permease family protein n=1 Tax=Nocardioides eburneus TaxID=3231482 RepID=A0ABV3T4U9_9ACTN
MTATLAAARLGARLGLTSAGRLRSLALALAVAIAELLMLTTASACRALLLQGMDPADDRRLALACATAIAIPCAVLVMTVARLSASMRDRRLAGLRLVGLTPTQTRVCAAAETGGAAVAGTTLGCAAFWLLRPLLAGIQLAGLDWRLHFAPYAVDSALAVIAPPVLAVASAVLPQRSRPDEALASARRADRTPPRPWRLGPLLVGTILCACVRSGKPRPLFGDPDDALPWMFAGIALLGVGILLIVPVFVRLFAALLVRLTHGPAVRLAARRLQAQPAGVARIVAVLMLGLFMATGARYVVVAWEDQNYYRYAEDQLHHRQLVSFSTTLAKADAAEARARSLPGVRAVVALPQLHSRSGYAAIVASCSDLARIEVSVGTCHDGDAYVLDPWSTLPKRWPVGHGAHRRTIATPVEASPPSNGATVGTGLLGPLDQVSLVLPPSLVGALPPSTEVHVAVTAAPGRHLASELAAVGLSVDDGYDFTTYDFVQRLKLLVWTIAGVILAVGLLAFGITAVDRTVQRRKQTTALRLVGVDAGTLRRAQWVEAGVPLAAGTVLSVGLGALAGATYLAYGEPDTALPWGATWMLAAVAVLGSALVGAATVIASSPRIRPQEIRAE